jgi:threonyl-tRNA synthetase
MKIKVNDKEMELQDGSSLKDLIHQINLKAPDQAVAASVNGKLRDFSCKLQEQDEVTIYPFQDPVGREVFWHSSAHVLAQAILRLFPNAKPTIGPPIENGFYYDFADLQISENDFPKIEAEVQKILEEDLIPKRIVFSSKEEALRAFEKNKYKKELIESFDEAPISAYEQGEFFDLCRGPHLPILSKIRAFKILKTSGAYWRGDANKEMLTRVYAISFPDKKSLKEYLHRLEEAKKRDHKLLGSQLELFSFKEEAPGMPFIYPKGMLVWDSLIGFLKESLKKADYLEIKTPTMMTKELWEKSGHWDHYKENMYISEIEDREFAIKPMNCPGCMLYYKSHLYSYRQLPLRISEIGHVHRFEPSGALNGLFRVRSFHQDDAHLFLKPEDIQTEIFKLLQLADKIYMTFGLSYHLELSTRPEKSKTIGSDEEWEVATTGLKDALEQYGHSYKINEGDGAFYGPKIDIHIQDALHRRWQCGTIQLDMSLPEKFQLEYVASDGSYQRPVMLHRALYGSIERFMGILIEHFAGKFPLWLSPYPIAILPIADRHVSYAKKLKEKCEQQGFIVDVDDSSESLGKKVRKAQMRKTNYILTVGDKEMENNSMALRTRDNVVHGEMTLASFLEKIVEEKKQRSLMSPFSIK